VDDEFVIPFWVFGVGVGVLETFIEADQSDPSMKQDLKSTDHFYGSVVDSSLFAHPATDSHFVRLSREVVVKDG
jgi:hypothetical protein